MRQLVKSWIQAEKEYYGNNLSAAIKLLNRDCNTSVTHSRVSEWSRGVYRPSQTVLSLMLLRVLPWALHQATIAVTEEQMLALEEMFWITIAERGERLYELL